MPYFVREDVCNLLDINEKLSARFTGEKVSLGTYIFQPSEEIAFTHKGLHLVAPHCKNRTEKTVLNIQKSEIVKILCNFAQESVLIVHVIPTCGEYIRKSLGMTSQHPEIGYFSPMAKQSNEKRIIINASISKETKTAMKSMFPSNLLEELSKSDILSFLNKK